MPKILPFLLLGLALLSYAFYAKAGVKGSDLEIILDVSGSMAGQIEGKSKLDIAKQTLNSLIGGIPEKSNVAFRAYGHQSLESAKNCTDTALLSPLGPINKTDMLAKINALQPRGWTPIDYTLRQAKTDFPSSSENTRQIILISDGEETCGGDPCAAVKELKNSGFEVRVNTIGFAVGAKAKEQLKCIAEASGGEYKSANNATELLDSLQTISARTFQGYTVSAGVTPGTGFNDAPLIAPGIYGGDILGGEIKFFKFKTKKGQVIKVGVSYKKDKSFNNTVTVGNVNCFSITAPGVAIYDNLRTGIADISGKYLQPGDVDLTTRRVDARAGFSGEGYISLAANLAEGFLGACQIVGISDPDHVREARAANTKGIYEMTFVLEGQGDAPPPPQKPAKTKVPAPSTAKYSEATPSSILTTVVILAGIAAAAFWYRRRGKTLSKSSVPITPPPLPAPPSPNFPQPASEPAPRPQPPATPPITPEPIKTLTEQTNQKREKDQPSFIDRIT